MRYNNYHKHTMYSNLRTLDCISKPMDYVNRAKELGHIVISGLNMLIYQAILSEEIWMGKSIDKEIVIEYFKNKL